LLHHIQKYLRLGVQIRFFELSSKDHSLAHQLDLVDAVVRIKLGIDAFVQIHPMNTSSIQFDCLELVETIAAFS
jgi:hypothetical protein